MSKSVSVSEITVKLTDAKADASLSFRKKIELAKMLDSLKVSVIEVGPILNGKQDTLLVKSLASAISGSALAVPVDIMDPDGPETVWASLKDAKHPRIQVSVPVSTVQMEYLCHRKPSDILRIITDTVTRCRSLCPEVEFIAGDFSRSDADFLSLAVSSAVQAGAGIVTLCDTAGNLLPDEFASAVEDMRKQLPEDVKLGVWCSNDMFLADSCAIASVIAGADEVKTSSYDRSTTSLKRFVHILQSKSDICRAVCDVNSTSLLRSVERIKILCEAKPKNLFRSLDGTCEDDRADMRLTVHDDLAAVSSVAAKLGYDLSDDDAAKVYETFARLAAKNETVGAKELDAIVASVAFQVPPTYRLESYVITSSNIVPAVCHLRVRKGDTVLDGLCSGRGPVDAAFQAIEKVVDTHFELDDFQIQSVTEGREALGEAVVRLRFGGKVYSGRGISLDIVGSSIQAYLNAVNKIAFEEETA